MLKVLQRFAAEVWVLLALPMLLISCLLVPPFYGADEIAHAERAIEIAHGQWVASRAVIGSTIAELPDVPPPDGSPLPTRAVTKENPAYGDPIDRNYLYVAMQCTFVQRSFLERYRLWTNRPDGRFPMQVLDTLRPVRWGGQPIFVNFQNTAVYPPPLYLPAATAWGIGEHFHLTILQSLYFSRASNALCALLLGWIALRLSGPERLFFAVVLLLPASLAVEASCSQDAVLLPLSILIASILGRAVRMRRAFLSWELAVLVPALALCVAARPPYLWLLVILGLPYLDLEKPGLREYVAPAASFAAVVLLVAMWRYRIRDAVLSHAAIADPAKQMLFIKTHPLHAAFTLVAGTLANIPSLTVHLVEILEMRTLRWMVVLFGIHILSFVCILVFSTKPAFARVRSVLVLLFSLVAVLATISFAEYLIWNAPGSSTIDGIQARYLLPLLAPAVFLSPFAGREIDRDAVLSTVHRSMLLSACIVFLTGLVLTPFLLAHRYYGTGLVAALQRVLG